MGSLCSFADVFPVSFFNFPRCLGSWQRSCRFFELATQGSWIPQESRSFSQRPGDREEHEGV